MTRCIARYNTIQSIHLSASLCQSQYPVLSATQTKWANYVDPEMRGFLYDCSTLRLGYPYYLLRTYVYVYRYRYLEFSLTCTPSILYSIRSTVSGYLFDIHRSYVIHLTQPIGSTRHLLRLHTRTAREPVEYVVRRYVYASLASIYSLLSTGAYTMYAPSQTNTFEESIPTANNRIPLGSHSRIFSRRPTGSGSL